MRAREHSQRALRHACTSSARLQGGVVLVLSELPVLGSSQPFYPRAGRVARRASSSIFDTAMTRPFRVPHSIPHSSKVQLDRNLWLQCPVAAAAASRVGCFTLPSLVGICFFFRHLRRSSRLPRCHLALRQWVLLGFSGRPMLALSMVLSPSPSSPPQRPCRLLRHHHLISTRLSWSALCPPLSWIIFFDIRGYGLHLHPWYAKVVGMRRPCSRLPCSPQLSYPSSRPPKAVLVFKLHTTNVADEFFFYGWRCSTSTSSLDSSDRGGRTGGPSPGSIFHQGSTFLRLVWGE